MEAILVHGGAGPMRDGRTEGCRRAAEAGYARLEEGASPVEAAQAAVVELEDDPVFNAGVGSYLAEDGRVYVDAAAMEGRDLAAGAVANVEGVRNPVRIARRILEDDLPHVLYSGPGARKLAERWELTVDPKQLITDEKRDLWAHGDPVGADTVGAIAVRDGHVACAQSTGGTPGKTVGRIGDAPLLALGLYADDRVGAALSTGHGESLMRIAAASRTLHRIRDGADPPTACRDVVDAMETRVGGEGGVLAATPDGALGTAWNTPHMAWASVRDGELQSGT